MFKRFLNSLYEFISTGVNYIFGTPSPPRPDWTWLVNTNPEQSPNSTFDTLFKNHMQDQGIKAGQFALRMNGTLIYSAAYTWSEQPGYKITMPSSVMRLASCSKPFTTTAILDLMRKNNLNGDEPVFELLKDFFPPDSDPVDGRVRKIIVKHLVEHLGGWDYSSNPLNASGDWAFHLKEMGMQMGIHIDHVNKKQFAEFVLNKIHLDFEPGTTPTSQLSGEDLYTYSNIGFILLGLVVEVKSKISFIDYLNQNILNPMGITNVTVGNTKKSELLGNEVDYEDPFSGPDATIDPFNPTSAPFPYGGDGSVKEVMDSGGGLVTSAESLALFISIHNAVLGTLNLDFLTDASISRMDSINQMDSRNPGVIKEGRMPGTAAVAKSIDVNDKNGTAKQFDYAILFNQWDKGYKTIGSAGNIMRLVDSIDTLIARI